MLTPKLTSPETASLILESIPYQADSTELFQAIRDLPYPIWLDSGQSKGFERGRFDILCAQPRTILTTTGEVTTIASDDGCVACSSENPFALLEAEVAKIGEIDCPDLPFTGGAMGYFGYHLNRFVETLPPTSGRDVNLPDMQVGIYDWALIQDHLDRQSWIAFLPGVSDRQKHQIKTRINQQKNSTDDSFSFYIKELKPEYDIDSYRKKLAKINEYILSGDAYQVNFAQRFVAEYRGDPFQAYAVLRQLLPAPYSAFIQLKMGAILCHSPELFLHLDDQAVVTKPIKGTRPRGNDPEGERRNIDALLNSDKDQAENLMIVDLLRNDLGKHCIPGSISVPELFALESFENVHHLVSTVTGQLRPDSNAIALLKDCFPGGSITGAPKVRAMEIIGELESRERSVYCGSIGYISCNGKMNTNIAIRTLVANGDKVYAWAGGGIVADSDPDEEYSECLDKIGILLDGLPRRS